MSKQVNTNCIAYVVNDLFDCYVELVKTLVAFDGGVHDLPARESGAKVQLF